MKKIVLIILILFCLSSAAETLTFGRYWQEDINFKEPIEWIILDETDDAYFLLSKNCLEAHSFGSMLWPCFWHNSDVRIFLNNYFYNSAFSTEEQQYIIRSCLLTPRNRLYANNVVDFYTYDKIFLLSIEEAEQYLSVNERIAHVTSFAKTQISDDKWIGAATYNDGVGMWWLRSNGATEYYGAFVNARGQIIYDGEMTYAPHYAVRPALWLSKEYNYDSGEMDIS